MSRAEVQPDVIIAGKKPLMNYVVACLTSFNQKADTVTLRARGSAISKAVDTVELLRRAFIKDLIIASISIGTEMVERDGRRASVSTIEIAIRKPAAPPTTL